eukprot:4386636-Karenia_brevis.AAC.1
MGYGQKALMQKIKAKAPNEIQMYRHQGVAWVAAAQGLIGLFQKAKPSNNTTQGQRHQEKRFERARLLVESFKAEDQ